MGAEMIVVICEKIGEKITMEVFRYHPVNYCTLTWNILLFPSPEIGHNRNGEGSKSGDRND